MMWQECKEMQEELVAMRRDLHKIPELGTQLPMTRDYVTKKLDEFGVPYTLTDKDSSVIAVINAGKPGKVIALRADMDALPIQEETGVPFSSEHAGCMHAGGHDTHTSMLLGAAKVLNEHKDELNGEVRFLFQTAEEVSKGAPIIVENGGVKGADAVFGTHIGTIIDKNIPAGTFIICPGPVMASFDRFVVTVKGTGCHGSTPEKGIDPVNIAAHIVIALQAINAREFNANVPVVITIGRIEGGKTYNAIPSVVEIEGTTRSFDKAVREKMAKRIEEISKYTALAFGGEAEVFMDWGAPPVVNDDAMAEFAANAVKEVIGDEMVITQVPHPNMGGEDFAYYLQEVPGAFMFLSSANPEKGTDIAHHNPKFNVDEDVFWIGTAAFVNIAEKFLNN